MKTIAICNHKGGVGKTALSMALAEGLHNRGYRTLLVDLDQQMNATQQAGISDTAGMLTVYDLLTTDEYKLIDDDAIKHYEYGDIVPGDRAITDAEPKINELDTKLNMLDDALDCVRQQYDFIIIDCPPQLGLVTRNAMVAADELIVPMTPSGFAADGFTKIFESVMKVRSSKHLNPNLEIAGILINMYDARTALSKEAVTDLLPTATAAGTKVFHTVIRRCEAVNRAQSAKQSIYEYDPKSNAVDDFNSFIDEYLNEEGEN